MRANCSICSDLFDGINTVIATPCGHIFHEICCLQWLEHSSTCPSCRRKMKRDSMVKLYFTFGNEDSSFSEDGDSKLRNELENVKAELKLKIMEKHKLHEAIEDLRKAAVKAEEQADLNHQKYLECQGQLTATRLQVKQLVKETSLLQNVADENKRLMGHLHHLKNVQGIVDNCQNDVSTLLSSWGGGSFSTKETATYITLLKNELKCSREARNKLSNELRGVKYDLGLKTSRLKEAEQELEKSQSELSFLREALNTLETDKRHKTPASASKKRFTSPDASEKDITATPFKRPKINFVSAVVNLVHSKPEVKKLEPQAPVLVPQASLFKPQFDRDEGNEDDSPISEGYNGLGGHTKFVSRSVPLKMKFTSLNKKASTAKSCPNRTLDRFLSL